MNPFLRCLLLYAPFLVLDIFSCALNVRRALKGRGPSGLPLVPVILYALLVAFFGSPGMDVHTKVLAAVVATLIHLTLVFAVPRFWRLLA